MNKSDAFFVELKKELRKESIGITFLTFAGKKPIQISGSGKHWAFVDENGRGFGFGYNGNQEISSRMGDRISLPFPLEFDGKLYEVACGNHFTAAIDHNMQVVMRGEGVAKNVIGQYSAPRSLNAYGNKICFAHKSNEIVVADKNGTFDKIEVDETVITCVINNKDVAILDSKGTVTIFDLENPSKPQKLPYNGIKAIYSGTDNILLIEGHIKIHIIENKREHTLFLPSGYAPVYGSCERGDIFLLDSTGNLAHALIGDTQIKQFNTNYNSIDKIPLHGSLNSFCLLGDRPLFVKGLPNPQLVPETPLAIRSGRFLSLPSTKDTFFAASESTAFFGKCREDTSVVLAVIASEPDDGGVFYTPTLRALRLDTTQSTFGVNLFAKDCVVVGGSQDAIVEGIGEGYVWVSVEDSPYVFAACPATLDDVNENIEIKERKGHDLQTVSIGGVKTAIDSTPSFVESFGYSVGDLVWAALKGTCEVVGVYANMLALLDIATRTVFSAPMDSLKVLRRASSALPHTRDVIRIDGQKVTLDISADGPRFFVPTDRVMSPLGIATVLGFADTAYIQTDEMRMNGYEAAPADVLTLQLVRRISMPAKRRVATTEGNIVTVSLDTESATDDILPGDVLAIGSTHARAIGVNADGWYAFFEGDSLAKLLPPSVALSVVYRADINATRNWTVPLQVGSPAINESLLLPGDTVNIREFEECEFVGFNDSSMVFVSHFSGEILSLSFSTCLIPGLFKVTKRPALTLAH